jgi:hypothetical protein
MAGAMLDALRQTRVPETWEMDRFHPRRITEQYLSMLNAGDQLEKQPPIEETEDSA